MNAAGGERIGEGAPARPNAPEPSSPQHRTLRSDVPLLFVPRVIFLADHGLPAHLSSLAAISLPK